MEVSVSTSVEVCGSGPDFHQIMSFSAALEQRNRRISPASMEIDEGENTPMEVVATTSVEAVLDRYSSRFHESDGKVVAACMEFTTAFHFNEAIYFHGSSCGSRWLLWNES